MSEKVNQTEIPPLQAGLLCRCPNCGRSGMFAGFLTLKEHCEVCDLDYSFADAGDGPAVFIILIVGFIVVGGALFVELAYQPPYWVHAALWLPLTMLLGLGLLRPFKATLVALQFKNKARQGELDQ